MSSSMSDTFKEEVKVLLSGYIESEDTRNYLALQICRLHEAYPPEDK